VLPSADCLLKYPAMKSAKTNAIYLRRINLARDYIDQNLNKALRLEDIAAASHFSSFHFHRIFHALVGETVNDYVSRKRMERAVYRLITETDVSITQVALSGGFSSSANFSKAFKLYFGITPSELRNPALIKGKGEESKAGKIFHKYGKAFNPHDLYSQSVTDMTVFDPDKLEEMLMNIKVENVDEKSIAYLSSPRGYELASVYNTWDRLNQWAAGQGISDDFQIRFARCHDNPAITPEDKCRYDAAVVIDPSLQLAEPFKQTTIPSGKYAIAYYKDVSDKINNFMSEICSGWLCSSGYEPDNYPPLFNYLNVSKESNLVEMNVYIKLKALAKV